jgi:hypothetical protein
MCDAAKSATTRGVRLSGRVLRRARTAATLPSRIVAVEDRTSAIEGHVAATLDAMRADIAELRRLVTAQLEADADATALLGGLLRSKENRLDEVEAQLAREQLPTTETARLPGGDSQA